MSKEQTIKVGIKNGFYAVLSQGVYLGLSIITSFLLPKFLGVTEFGYWQVYLFYSAYIGFFHFGFIDGMYLRYGDKNYLEIPFNIFRSGIKIFLVILIAFAILFDIFICFEVDPNKQVALLGVDAGIIIVCLRTYFTYILQFTNQIKRYSITTVLNRLIFAILIILMFIFKIDNFKYVIIFDLLAQFLTLMLCAYWCKDIIFGKGVGVSKGIQEVWNNIKVGINLMLANIMGMLITGIGRFMVERSMNIDEFSLYSFANTATQLALTFINAISLVIYPMLKRMDKKEIPEFYNRINIMLCAIIFVSLLLYFPIYLIVLGFLPEYSPILEYLYILFPIIIANGKISIVINTYYKALREEKAMFKANLACVLFFVLLAMPIFYFYKSVKLLSFCTLIAMLALCYVSEIYLKTKMGIHNFSNIVEEILLVLGFLFFTSIKPLWLSFIGYAIMLIIYLIKHRQEVGYYLIKILELFRKSE